MRFINKISEKDLYSYLQENLNTLYSSNYSLNNDNNKTSFPQNIECLGGRVDSELSNKFSEALNDPAIKGLTSARMMDNLEQKGWVFNAKDQNWCQPGEEPQLTQEELKKLRSFLEFAELKDNDMSLVQDEPEFLSEEWYSEHDKKRHEAIKAGNAKDILDLYEFQLSLKELITLMGYDPSGDISEVLQKISDDVGDDYQLSFKNPENPWVIGKTEYVERKIGASF